MNKRFVCGALAMLMMLGQHYTMTQPLLMNVSAAETTTRRQDEPSDKQESENSASNTTTTVTVTSTSKVTKQTTTTSGTTVTTSKTTKTTKKTTATTAAVTTTTTTTETTAAVTESRSTTTPDTTTESTAETTTTTDLYDGGRPEYLDFQHIEERNDRYEYKSRAIQIQIVPELDTIYFGQQWDQNGNWIEPQYHFADRGGNEITEKNNGVYQEIRKHIQLRAHSADWDLHTDKKDFLNDAETVPSESQAYWYTVAFNNVEGVQYGQWTDRTKNNDVYSGGYMEFNGTVYHVYIHSDAYLNVKHYDVPELTPETDEERIYVENPDHVLSDSLSGVRNSDKNQIDVTDYSPIYMKNTALDEEGEPLPEYGAIGVYHLTAELTNVQFGYLVREEKVAVNAQTTKKDEDGNTVTNATTATTSVSYYVQSIDARNCRKDSGNKPKTKHLNIFEDGGYLNVPNEEVENFTVEKTEGGVTKITKSYQLVLIADAEDNFGQAVPKLGDYEFSRWNGFIADFVLDLVENKADFAALDKMWRRNRFILVLEDGNTYDDLIEMYFGQERCDQTGHATTYSIGNPDYNKDYVGPPNPDVNNRNKVLYYDMPNKVVVDCTAPTVPKETEQATDKSQFGFHGHGFQDPNLYSADGNVSVSVPGFETAQTFRCTAQDDWKDNGQNVLRLFFNHNSEWCAELKNLKEKENRQYSFKSVILTDKAGNTTKKSQYDLIYDQDAPEITVKPSKPYYETVEKDHNQQEIKKYWFQAEAFDEMVVTISAIDNYMVKDVKLNILVNGQTVFFDPNQYDNQDENCIAKHIDTNLAWINMAGDEEGEFTKEDGCYSLSELLAFADTRNDSWTCPESSEITKVELIVQANDSVSQSEEKIILLRDDAAPTMQNVKVRTEEAADQKFFRVVTFGLYSKCNLVFSLPDVKDENGSGFDTASNNGASGAVVMQWIADGETHSEQMAFRDGQWVCTVNAETLNAAEQISFVAKDNVGNSAEYFVKADAITQIKDVNDNQEETLSLYATEEAADFGIQIEQKEPVIDKLMLMQGTDDTETGEAWSEKADYWFKAVREGEGDKAKAKLADDMNYRVQFTARDAQSGLYRVSYVLLPEDEHGSEITFDELYSFKTLYEAAQKDEDVTAPEIITAAQTFTIPLSDIVSKAPERLDRDGKYTVRVTVEDFCGNRNEKTEFTFFADCKAPKINSIRFTPDEADKRTADQQKDFTGTIRMGDMFGFYFNGEAVARVEFVDEAASSGIKKVEYILDETMKLEKWTDASAKLAEIKADKAEQDKTDKDKADKDKADKDKADWDDREHREKQTGETKGIAEFKIPKGYRGMIYVKVTDNTDNTSGPVTPKDAFVIDDEEMHKSIEHVNYSGLGETNRSDADGCLLFADGQKVTVKITDVESGIRSVNVALKSENIGALTYELNFENHSDEYEVGKDFDGWIIDKMDRNLVTEIHREFSFPADDNGITFKTIMMDRARNEYERDLEAFSIDKTKPVLTASYADGALGSKDFSNGDRVLRIRVTDRNFGGSVSFNGAGHTLNLVDEANHIYSGEIVISGEGEHGILLFCEDLAGNQSGELTDRFEIDMTPMQVNSNIDKYFEEDKFYSGDLSFTFTFNDKNFDQNLVHYDVRGSEADAWDAKWNGDTLTISLKEEGRYQVTVTGSDKAGNNNLMLNEEKVGRTALSSAMLEIDKTSPVLVSPAEQESLILGKQNESDPDGWVRKSRVPDVIFSDKNIASITGSVTRYFIKEEDGEKIVEHETKKLTTTGEIVTEDGKTPTISWVFEPFNWTGSKQDDQLPDGIYTIELTAKDKADLTCASHHTVFVQTKAECMMYIPVEELKKFDGIGKKNDRFGALKAHITALVPKDQDVEILIGGIAVPEKYLTVIDDLHPTGWKNGGSFAEKTIELNLAYVQDTYKKEDMVDSFALSARSACGGEETLCQLATISIDNAKPRGSYRSDIAATHYVYDADSYMIVIEGVSVDTNLELCEFSDIVDGKQRTIPTDEITFDGKAISFMLHEGDHRLSIMLRDDAGNENGLDPFSIYIGSFMKKWGGVIFGVAGGVAAVIAGSVAVMFVRKRRRERAPY